MIEIEVNNPLTTIVDLTGLVSVVSNSQEVTKSSITKFPDGQQNISVKLNNPYNHIEIRSFLRNFEDLELIICANQALKLQGATNISLYVPYVVGARSDRRFSNEECNYLRDVVCPIINSQDFKKVTVLDPHSDVLEACINNFVKKDNSQLLEYVVKQVGTEIFKNYAIVSPDAGASKKIYKLLEKLNLQNEVIVCSKDRGLDGKINKLVIPEKAKEYQQFLIIDDICDGGRTFNLIAEHLSVEFGFLKENLKLMVTHGIFSKGLFELNDNFDTIYSTNSYNGITESKVKYLDVWTF